LKLGDLATAERDFEDAISIHNQISKRPDAPDDIQVDVALSKNNLGLLLQRRGDFQASERLISGAIDTLRHVAKTEPKNIRARRGLALALNNVANLKASVDPQTAERLLQDALDIQLDTGQSSTRSLRASLDLVATFTNLGSVALRQKDWGKAEASNRKAISISRELVKLSPKVELYQQDLAFSLNNLGVALREQERSQEAIEVIEEAVQLQTALSQNSQNHGVLAGLGSSWNNLALIRANLGELAAAKKAYDSAIRIQQQALELSPKSDVYRQNLSKSLANLTGLLRQLRDQEGELQLLRVRRELWSSSPNRMVALAEEIAPVAAGTPQYWDELVANLRGAKAGGYTFDSEFWERPTIRPLAQQLRPLIDP
jgi:tetratricopeptide (TPR) repeat protein